ncbi:MULTISPECIES: xanthine dehydrogenase family protein subunit M [Rhodococcus]|uniref:FAD binding domain-containing protein n=1 Tax=Rhodococcus TaxID=1827 RepID=UPI0013EC3D40|nr:MULTISPECIES: xanthine dehydrogenase family protein subunit M [Rhodococcus]UTT48486.1 xanthine dehydrogenase family protein subunit M [Rhodococcus gordoniae]
MKPPLFEYEAPRTVDEALDLLADAQEGATILAGGQSLLPLLNMRFARPDLVIDINRVQGLGDITITETTVSTGAIVRLATLENDPAIRSALPVLGTAASYVAHPQIRARTTIGGTLSHADPSAEMPTVAVALGATINLRSQSGSRAVAAEDFFESVFATSKSPDELIVSIDFPIRRGMTFVYDEISRRQGDFPFAGLCLGITLDNGLISDVRAAGAGVADVPQRLHQLEGALRGNTISETIEDAVEAAGDEVDPPTDIHGTAAFRRSLLRTLVRRALTELDEEQK